MKAMVAITEMEAIQVFSQFYSTNVYAAHFTESIIPIILQMKEIQSPPSYL